MMSWFKKLGPGIMFAGAAIGVSHLVQSTRAGADFGFGLIWALLLINLIKYPFFAFGVHYTSNTGEDLLTAFKKMGRWVLVVYFLLTLCTMFTFQTAVTIVTAGIATSLTGIGTPVIWAGIILLACFLILLRGRFSILDKVMKYVVLTLTLTTVLALIFAWFNAASIPSWSQTIPNTSIGIAFLIAFMGWMPAPLDLAIWQSLWAVEKKQLNPELESRQVRWDFNIGYGTTIVIGLSFILLGGIVMYDQGQEFSNSGAIFANQLISMYTDSLGQWSKALIGIAALTTMFSTSLSTLDGSPRVMAKTSSLLFAPGYRINYITWLIILVIGSVLVYLGLTDQMGPLITVGTVLSFISAPFYAIVIYKVVTGPSLDKKFHPSPLIKGLSIFAIVLLIGFSLWYLSTI
jgi:Mn2+/Fe2+ NRAMP family transporter